MEIICMCSIKDKNCASCAGVIGILGTLSGMIGRKSNPG